MQMSYFYNKFIPAIPRRLSAVLFAILGLLLFSGQVFSCPPTLQHCDPCFKCENGECVADDPSCCTYNEGSWCEPPPCPKPCCNNGVPKLSLSPDRASILINDVPIAYKPAAGPEFNFIMDYSTTDPRGWTNAAWEVGYKWRHNYQIHIERTGTNYQMVLSPNYGPRFISDGNTNMVQNTNGCCQGKYIMKWFGSNIVVHPVKWDDLAAENGRTPGCASCGGGGASRPAGPDVSGLMPPYASWSARAGYEFEPDGSGMRYRLAKIIGNDEKELTLSYSNNLINVVTTADSNQFLFSYTTNGLLDQITDPFDRSAQFTYTTNGLLETVTDMADQTFKYGYNESGYLTSLMRPATNGWDTTRIDYEGTYTYSVKVNILYPEGNESSVHWDGATMHDLRNGLGGSAERVFENYSWGKIVAEQEDAVGRVTSYLWFDYTNSYLMGKIKNKVLPDGSYKSYGFDSNGKLSLVSDYDKDGNLLNQSVFSNAYFPGTVCLQSSVNQKKDNLGNVLGETITTYGRDDRGTPSDPSDDVYMLSSVRTLVAAGQYKETRYVYDTNNVMTAVQELVGPGTNDFRTTRTYSYSADGRVSSVADALTNATSFAYDAIGRISSVSNSAGATTYNYSDLDEISGKTYPDGSSESWTTAVCGCGPGQHVDRGGNTTTYIYDGNKRLKSKKIVSTNQTVLFLENYSYIGENKLSATEDALGNREQNEYYINGDLMSVIDKLGRQTLYEYDQFGRPSSIIYPDGSISSNTYNEVGQLIKVAKYASVDSATPLTFEEYSYDAGGQRLTTKDALGNVTSNSYDMAGRTIKTTYADGSFSETEYDLIGNVTKQVEKVPAGATQQQKDDATTTYAYDVLNRRVSTTDSMNRTTTWEYDSIHPQQVKYVRNANNQIVQESFFDVMGRVTTNISQGVKTVYEYNSAGQATKISMPDGSYSSSAYDGPRLMNQSSRTGNTSGYGYDALGRRIAITNALGQVTLTSNDAVGNLLSMTDPLNHVTSYSFDVMNRQISMTYPDSRVSTNGYDALGRLTAKTGAGSVPANYSYDALSRMTQLKDGEGNPTKFAYDSLSRLNKKTYADNSFYSYGYNARGWLTNRTDALARATGYEYNNAGQLTKIDYPSDTDIIFAMDTLGRTTQRVDSAGTWSWTYEGESSRVLSEIANRQSEIENVSYSYSSNTYDLASMSCGSVTTLYSWSQGRLTSISVDSELGTLNFNYSYVPNSDLLSTLTSDLGHLTSRSYDSANRLLSVSNLYGTNIISSFNYTLDSTGRRIQSKIGNRQSEIAAGSISYGYDQYDQLTSASKTNSPNAALDAAYNFKYQYDQVGNRLHEDRGQMDLDGTFNPLNQLIYLNYSGFLDVYGTVTGTNSPFTVKVNGQSAALYNTSNFLGGAKVKSGTNVVSIVVRDSTGTNQYNLVRKPMGPPVNPQQFVYDLNGNMTSDGRFAYSWDEENRLISVESVTSVVKLRSEFAYDAQSRRIAKTDYSGFTNGSYSITNTTQFIYDGWNLIAEQSTLRSLGEVGLIYTTNHYVWGLDLSQSLQGAGGVGGLLAVIRSDTNSLQPSVYLPVYDGNGNISDYVSTNGVVVAHREYDPFGNTVVSTGQMKDAFNFWFSTKYYDLNWKTYYYGYRYYSSSLGRWLSRDPIDARMIMLNLYAYVDNDITAYVDTDGRVKYWTGGSQSGINDFYNVSSTISSSSSGGPSGANDFWDMMNDAAGGSTSITLRQEGDALQKIKEEARTVIQGKLSALTCTSSDQSYTVPINFTESHQFGGKLFNMDVLVHPLNSPVFHYNFYTVANAEITADFKANVRIGPRRAFDCRCAYYVDFAGNASINDQFDFYPDHQWNSIPSVIYNLLAAGWALGFNEIGGASRPSVYGRWDDSWRIAGRIK